MDPELWRRIEEIYYKALAMEPAERRAYLDQCCAGDNRLRKEVDRLLQDQPAAESFIESPAVEIAAKVLFGGKEAMAIESTALQTDIDVAGIRTRKHAPGWMYLIAAVFLICAAVRYYGCFAYPDSNLGWTLQTIKNQSGMTELLIRTVEPGSAAAKAGAEPGDILLPQNSDGLFQVPGQPDTGPYYWKNGHTYRIEVRRREESRFINLTIQRMPLKNWIILPRLRPPLVSLLISILEFILAAIIAFRKPDDITARMGALFLAALGIIIIYGFNLDYGWLSIVVSLPRPFSWLVVLFPGLCEGLFVSIGITFAALFPRRLFHQRWIWHLFWLPAAMLVPLIVFSGYLRFYSFPKWYPDWYRNLAVIAGLAGWLAIAVFLIMNYRALRNLNDRRRIRVLVAGGMISVLGYMFITAAKHLPGWSFVSQLMSPPYNILLVLSCLGCALPIAMAYAILKHRLFDIRVMIRQGVQYAAGRGALLSLAPFVVILMAGDLLIHRSQTLEAILSRRGLLYALLAGGGVTLHLCQRKWLDALDRRFFREQYNAQRVLRAVIEEIREARSFEKVAPSVVSKIETALHPEFAAVLVRRPGETKYRALAAQEKAPPPISASSKLIALMRVLGKPVDISESQSGWLSTQLPAEESEFLRRARLEWLFPISLTEGQTEALLVVGPKRSEMPYSREDQELLQGITTSLALLLEQSPIAVSDSRGFEECPECGTCYDSGSGNCRKEGAVLTPLPFPRLLAQRYRFEKRLGAGGMGMVYQALDTELDRQVAVKLIRPELTASTDAALRFRQEAKAAASFSHPNVVTVHDYGVSEKQGAYLVMELLRGMTLRQLMNETGRLSAERALEILEDVCAAVNAAHRKRLLHRDLKPENIFLTDSEGVETVKILDFGVVKHIAGEEFSTRSVALTEPGVLAGTLKYMSPEELRGEPPAESWDLWALTVVAYEMLVGVHPFSRATSSEIRNAILDDYKMPLQKHLPEAPATWHQFFDRALAYDPASRPQSAVQLLSDFKQSIA
ncbi:MAG: protein kinase [Acidobacteria bacterium]|nr:protein kinase [Acidobacteriota bacterium]